ncbi:hypothetical protein ASC80_01670 [Afipia sp. Root123D2]|uniref:hypothetical protein n=1 Tax=Afipia sp. Root123D2 TaxID=1736436 RepID=UPI0006F44D59|nr:hypothetical protein [Afipia sp. Root123D2]KQW22131.1 hypothetical protein ASC80_01670 [Afipia sp. Root123D2]
MEKPKQEAPEAFKGKKNIYVCDACHGHIVTIDVDAGVTPFMINCRAHPRCKGTMRSSMYRVFDQDMAASHEWYRPTPDDCLRPGEIEHVLKGGLLLRTVNQMGLGIAAAASDAPVHAQLINDLKEQLLIVFLRRLGGKLSLPVAEVDDTGSETLSFNLENGDTFNFELCKKH